MTDVATPGASDRIAAIRAAMTDDAEAGATFAESVRASIEAALTRLDTLSGAAPHAEAAALLDHVRDRISGLDPARLEPRRGLAGLFDSRGKRLKAFRAAYLSAADASASGAADLADRGAAIARRGEDLEGLWNGLRTSLSDLDDQLAAGRAWLTDRIAPPASTVPPEAAAAFEDMPETPVDGEPAQNEAEAEPDVTPAVNVHEASDPAEPSAESEVAPAVAAPSDHPSPQQAEVIAEVVETGLSEAPVQEAIAEALTAEPAETASDHAASDAEPVDRPAEVTNLPHPLEARLDALMELRTRAVGALPRVRALQNADHAVPPAISSVRDHIEAWRADWRDALGLSGKRPKRIRPDLSRLEQSRQALIQGLGAAERTLAATRSRHAELSPPTPITEAQRVAA